MPKERITAAIREVLNEQFGFEIYIVMKQEERKRSISGTFSVL